VGLPGNPLAACAAVVTLLEPLLDALHGHARPRMMGRLVREAPARPDDNRRHRLVPVACRTGGELDDVPACGAAMLRGLAAATGLAVIGPNGAGVRDPVHYLPLPWTPAALQSAPSRLSTGPEEER
jgi:molybdopterin molybdotransferase